MMNLTPQLDVRRHLLMLPLVFTLGACQSPPASTVSAQNATRVQGWDGVNNLFREGRFYFGGQPDEASLKRLATEVGVTTVVNIRHPEELLRLDFDEEAAADSLGLRYITIPVAPATFSTEDVDRFAEVVNSSEEPILLHCASSNRVGGMWAAYLVRHRGVDLEKAIAIGKTAGLRSDGMIEATRRVAGG